MDRGPILKPPRIDLTSSWSPEQSRQWLEGIEYRGMQLGLERVTEFARRLDNPERAFPSILIAGTNGKGSVAAIVDSILCEAGIATGRYTSPHLIDWPERITVGGREITDEDLARALQAVSRDADELEATPFEVFTMAAMWYFREQGVEWGVIEVGLGGRLDATRLTDARITVITAIGRDHIGELGTDPLVIAREKGAIMRSGVPVVFGPGTDPVKAVLSDEAGRIGSQVTCADELVTLEAYHTSGWEQNGSAHWSDGRAGFSWRFPLAGEHMLNNLSTSLTVVSLLVEEGLVIPDAALIDGIGKVRWPGRLQLLSGGSDRPDLILEVGHNPMASRAVAREITIRAGSRPVGLVVALAEDKELERFLEPLVECCSRFTATSWSGERARSPEEMDRAFRALVEKAGMDIPSTVAGDPETALRETASVLGAEAIIVVIGSHMLVGEVLEAVNRGGLAALLSG